MGGRPHAYAGERRVPGGPPVSAFLPTDAVSPTRGVSAGTRLAACVAALAVSGSCVYTTGTALPAHVRTVRAEVFDNRTRYPGLDAELADALVRELLADGTLRPASRNADSVLRGRLVSVRVSVLEEDDLDDLVAGQVRVAAVVTLEDVAARRNLLENESVTSREVLDAEGVYRLRRGETELDARLAAVRALARNIVRRVVEVW